MMRRRLGSATTAVLLVTTLSCASPMDGAGAQGPVVAVVRSCARTDLGTRDLVVGFEPGSALPRGLASLFPQTRLWSFAYRVGARRHVVLPVPPGVAAELGLDPGGTAAAVPPPVAIVPISGDPPQRLVFDSLRLVVDGSVRVRAPRLEGLRGRSVETPLGRATIQDARLEGRRAEIVVRFEWLPGLRGETPIRPDVTLVPRVRPGGVVLEQIALPLGEGAIRTVTFTVPSGGSPRVVILQMRSFGLFVPGPVAVPGVREACR